MAWMHSMSNNIDELDEHDDDDHNDNVRPARLLGLALVQVGMIRQCQLIIWVEFSVPTMHDDVYTPYSCPEIQQYGLRVAGKAPHAHNISVQKPKHAATCQTISRPRSIRPVKVSYWQQPQQEQSPSLTRTGSQGGRTRYSSATSIYIRPS